MNNIDEDDDGLTEDSFAYIESEEYWSNLDRQEFGGEKFDKLERADLVEKLRGEVDGFLAFFDQPSLTLDEARETFAVEAHSNPYGEGFTAGWLRSERETFETKVARSGATNQEDLFKFLDLIGEI